MVTIERRQDPNAPASPSRVVPLTFAGHKAPAIKALRQVVECRFLTVTRPRPIRVEMHFDQKKLQADSSRSGATGV